MADPGTFFAKHPLVRRLLFPAAALVFYVLFLVLTFPYDVLARRLEVEAQRIGAELTIGALGPAGIGGLRARDVRLKLPSAQGETLPELRLDRADLSPDLFALVLRRTSFAFALEGYGGKARGHAAFSNDPRQPGLLSLRLDAHDFDLHEL